MQHPLTIILTNKYSRYVYFDVLFLLFIYLRGTIIAASLLLAECIIICYAVTYHLFARVFNNIVLIFVLFTFLLYIKIVFFEVSLLLRDHDPVPGLRDAAIFLHPLGRRSKLCRERVGAFCARDYAQPRFGQLALQLLF